MSAVPRSPPHAYSCYSEAQALHLFPCYSNPLLQTPGLFGHLGAHALYSEIKHMSQACVFFTIPSFLSYPILVYPCFSSAQVVGREAQYPSHLGTFSAEDCEVMALGENGLPDRNLNKQPDCSTFSCGCLNQLQLSGQIAVHMYSTLSTPCSLASLQ